MFLGKAGSGCIGSSQYSIFREDNFSLRGAAKSLLLLTGMRVHFDFVSATQIELPSVVERAVG